jgi:hypothetical protein
MSYAVTMNVEATPVEQMVAIINEYSPQTRAAAGEQASPFPEPPVVPDRDRQELVAVAEQLWPVFGTDDNAQRARLLNTFVRHVGLAPRLRADGTMAWVGSSGELTRCLITLLEIVASYGWSAISTCAGDDCVDVFVRTSGRGGRRFCSTTCLNRNRVRAYRARQRIS